MNINLLCHGMKIYTYIQSYIYNHVGVIPEIKGWFNIQKNINAIHHVNRLKKTNHTVISFMENTFRTLGIERNFFNLVQNCTKIGVKQ